MTSEIKQFVAVCEICRQFETANQKETLMPHEVPDRPWEVVGTDLFELEGVDYLVAVDYFSNFWEVDRLDDTQAKTVVRKLKAHFARFGIPNKLVSDNGSQFTSRCFRVFTDGWDIEHVACSPHHSNANGMAESAVKTAKKIMRKCKESGQDVYLAILAHRNTPSQGIDASPAQRLLDRRTRTLVPTASKLLEPKSKDLVAERKKLMHNKERQSYHHDKRAKDLPPLEEGDTVRMKPHTLGEKVWKRAMVSRRLDERSYDICAEDGRSYRRNRIDLKHTEEPPPDFTLGWEGKSPSPMSSARHGQVNKGGHLKNGPATMRKAKAGTKHSPTADDKNGSPESGQDQHILGPQKPTGDDTSPKGMGKEVTRTRSGRVSQQPKHLEDFVT